MSLALLTSTDAVRKALDEFDEIGRDAFLQKYGFGRSRRYFLVEDEKLYDSKAIVGAAIGYEHPERGPLTSSEFSGGETTVKAKLVELGFTVKVPAGLRDGLTDAMKAIQNREPGTWSKDVAQTVIRDVPGYLRQVAPEGYKVKGGVGFGRQAEVPWVALFPPGVEGAQEGRYVVYLFAADGNSVFLCLSQAATHIKKHELKPLAESLRSDAGEQDDLSKTIDLKGKGDLGRRYELATAYALKYDADALPDDEHLLGDLARFLELLESVLGEDKISPPGLSPDLEELRTLLLSRGQVILQGPPGVGKTYRALQYLELAAGTDPDGFQLTGYFDALGGADADPSAIAEAILKAGVPLVWDIVQFHPSYTYEDFVRGLVAQPLDGGGVTFAARNKIAGLMAGVAAVLAEIYPDAQAVLIIDEINRGDISKILGELIFALEYRNRPVASPYEVNGSAELVLPDNLYFIGTMNTADRSIALVDYALRRRFVFLDVQPDAAVIANHERFADERDRAAAEWLFNRVAQRFPQENRDLAGLQVGHSYFLLNKTPQSWEEGCAVLARRFGYEVYPLLLEYEAEGRFETDPLDPLLELIGFGPTERPRQRAVVEKVVELLQHEPWKA